MGRLSRVVIAALDKLGHEHVDVMGFSFGGALAQQIAYDAPDRVRRLALVATGCGMGSTPGALSAMSAVANPLRYYSREWYELTNRLLGEPLADDSYATGRFENMPTPLGYTYQLLALASWSSRKWLHRVETPTLVVSGGRDRLIPPDNAVQLARLLPNNRLQLMPGAAHLLMFHHEGVAAKLLSDFFSSPTLEDSTAWSDGLDLAPGSLGEAA
jgi:pimeloyl-ACP methyl ester carboxylesterase